MNLKNKRSFMTMMENDIDNRPSKKSNIITQYKSPLSNSIIYNRISTKNQTLGTSLESQSKLCREYCTNNGFNIIGEYNEVTSARFMENQTMLHDIIEQHENFNLVVYEPTRLSRNINYFTNLVNQCKQKNIIICFVEKDWISTNNTDFKSILSSVYDGQIESENISNRIKRAIQYKKINNTYLPSIPTFGYNYERKIVNNKIVKNKVINEQEQKIILLVNKLYYGSDVKEVNQLLTEITNQPQELIDLNDDENSLTLIEEGNLKFVDIAELLNSLSIMRRGNQWNANSVSKLVKN